MIQQLSLFLTVFVDVLRFFSWTKCLMQKPEASRIWMNQQSTSWGLPDSACRLLRWDHPSLKPEVASLNGRRLVSHPPASSSPTQCCLEPFMFNRALSVRRAGVAPFHATANQNCAPSAAMKSSNASYQIPTSRILENMKNHTLLNKYQKYSLRAGLIV